MVVLEWAKFQCVTFAGEKRKAGGVLLYSRMGLAPEISVAFLPISFAVARAGRK